MNVLCSCLFQHPAHYRALLSYTIHLCCISGDECNTQRRLGVKQRGSVFTADDASAASLSKIEITVFNREVLHPLMEKRLHQRQPQETPFISLFKTKYMQCNTHKSIQADCTNPISLLHRLTLSILFNRWRTICSME